MHPGCATVVRNSSTNRVAILAGALIEGDRDGVCGRTFRRIAGRPRTKRHPWIRCALILKVRRSIRSAAAEGQRDWAPRLPTVLRDAGRQPMGATVVPTIL